MKLLPVLLLAALPFYCYAGPGCKVMDEVIKDTIDVNVTPEQFIEKFQRFIAGEETEKALTEMKQCLMNQDQATRDNVKVMVDAVYNSFWCARY
ncbi:mammaglobin-A-like [Saccopteryx bilineata]|uniref:mammaglobin-A-like n=1 Tax=Saccopteryx bilineata TaxID=59482 RepID=UPI00338D50A1